MMARNGMYPAKMHQAEIVSMFIRTLLESQKELHKEWVAAARTAGSRPAKPDQL